MKLDPTNPFLTPFVKRVFEVLRPMDVEGMKFVHKGREGDGGYVMLNDFTNIRTAYSIGIGGDVSWDVAMAEYGIEIWQYDHTIESPNVAHPRFHFQRLGLAATASKDGMLNTLESFVAESGRDEFGDSILKIDIEGAEWDVLPTIPLELLGRFAQILVEFHNLRNLNKAGVILQVLNTLAHINQTHQSVHVHANNYGEIVTIGGIAVPDVLEVTFARRSTYNFVPCHRFFPTILDFPNNPAKADYLLGHLGLVQGCSTLSTVQEPMFRASDAS